MPSRSGGLIRPHHPTFAMLHRMLDSAVILFALDLKIMALTVVRGFAGPGTY